MYEDGVVGYFHDETSPGVYTHLTDEAGDVFLVVVRDASNGIVGLKTVEAPGAGGVLEAGSEAVESMGKWVKEGE